MTLTKRMPTTADSIGSRRRIVKCIIQATDENKREALIREIGASNANASKWTNKMDNDKFNTDPNPDVFARKSMVRQIKPAATLSQLVVPPDTLTKLRNITRDFSPGKNSICLFVGPAGIGKTRAAEAVANELGEDLYRIDLAAVVSNYIGETEKNLQQIFAAAEQSGAILLLDEADALFGKRSEVRDSHDRYANIDISALLQRMEAYPGIVILASNKKHVDDAAFRKRSRYIVDFPGLRSETLCR